MKKNPNEIFANADITPKATKAAAHTMDALTKNFGVGPRAKVTQRLSSYALHRELGLTMSQAALHASPVIGFATASLVLRQSPDAGGHYVNLSPGSELVVPKSADLPNAKH